VRASKVHGSTGISITAGSTGISTMVDSTDISMVADPTGISTVADGMLGVGVAASSFGEMIGIRVEEALSSVGEGVVGFVVGTS